MEATMSTEHVLQEQMLTALSKTMRPPLQAFRETALKHYSEPLNEWPEKATEKFANAANAISLSPAVVQDVMEKVSRVESNRAFMDGRAERAKQLAAAGYQAKQELEAAEAALRAARVKHAEAQHAISNDLATWKQLVGLEAELWFIYGDIDAAVARLAKMHARKGNAIETLAEVPPAKYPLARGA